MVQSILWLFITLIVRPFLSQFLILDTPKLACEGEIWGFVSSKSELYSTFIIAVLCKIPWYIEPRYNGTRRYVSRETIPHYPINIH